MDGTGPRGTIFMEYTKRGLHTRQKSTHDVLFRAYKTSTNINAPPTKYLHM
jgi:hypothetical protein